MHIEGTSPAPPPADAAPRGSGPDPGSWRLRVEPAPGRLVVAGTIGAAGEHAHAAAQVMVCVSGAVLLAGPDGRETAVRAAVIPAGRRHRLRPAPGPVPAGVMLWADAGSPTGRLLHDAAADGPASGAGAWKRAAAGLSVAAEETTEEAAARVVGLLDRRVAEAVGDRSGGPDHPAVVRLLRLLPGAVGEGPVRLAEIAPRVGVSASRLGHLLAAHLGVSFPVLVRWSRLHAAIDAARQGANATEAAHAAGFADSAHLTRVCKEMFGITPSQALVATRFPANRAAG